MVYSEDSFQDLLSDKRGMLEKEWRREWLGTFDVKNWKK